MREQESGVMLQRELILTSGRQPLGVTTRHRERWLILSPSPALDELQNAFEYDPKTGFFVHKLRPSPRVQVDRVAGSLHPSGYIRIRFNYYRLFNTPIGSEDALRLGAQGFG